MEEEKVPHLSSEWKELGNKFFQDNQMQQALDAYNKAIEADGSISIYFSNRARCLKILERFQEALNDSNQAMELDASNIKAHLLGGQLLAIIGRNSRDVKKIELAIIRMTKALTLCAGQKMRKYESDLTVYILRARKLLCMLKQSLESERKTEILAILFDKIQNEVSLTEQLKEEKKILISEAFDRKQPVQQIPMHFTCALSKVIVNKNNQKQIKKLLREPITTKYGHTYEKETFEKLINSNGATDPLAKLPIQQHDAVPNINLRQAIENFLEQNPWAYEYSQDQSIQNIEF